MQKEIETTEKKTKIKKMHPLLLKFKRMTAPFMEKREVKEEIEFIRPRYTKIHKAKIIYISEKLAPTDIKKTLDAAVVREINSGAKRGTLDLIFILAGVGIGFGIAIFTNAGCAVVP